jgi:hypothetical protein
VYSGFEIIFTKNCSHYSNDDKIVSNSMVWDLPSADDSLIIIVRIVESRL